MEATEKGASMKTVTVEWYCWHGYKGSASIIKASSASEAARKYASSNALKYGAVVHVVGAEKVIRCEVGIS